MIACEKHSENRVRLRNVKKDTLVCETCLDLRVITIIIIQSQFYIFKLIFITFLIFAIKTKKTKKQKQKQNIKIYTDTDTGAGADTDTIWGIYVEPWGRLLEYIYVG